MSRWERRTGREGNVASLHAPGVTERNSRSRMTSLAGPRTSRQVLPTHGRPHSGPGQMAKAPSTAAVLITDNFAQPVFQLIRRLFSVTCLAKPLNAADAAEKWKFFLLEKLRRPFRGFLSAIELRSSGSCVAGTSLICDRSLTRLGICRYIRIACPT
jgi:hypothetical protein